MAAIHDEACAPWIDSLPRVFGWRRMSPEDVLGWVEEDRYETAVAHLGGEPVGYARAQIRRTTQAMEIAFVSTDEHAGQSRIAVRPAFRRRGIGTALVESVIERQAADAPCWAWAGAYGDNEAAGAFLDRLGFEMGRFAAPCPFTVDPHRGDDSVLATYDLRGTLPDVRVATDVVVREIRERDVEAMRRVFGEARPLALGPRPTAEAVLAWLRGGWGETILVAERRGTVIGCMEHRTSGVIGIPGVLPEYRGRGVGSALLVRLLAAMKGKGLGTALADTGHFDRDAIRLYDRLGFDTTRWLRSWMRKVS